MISKALISGKESIVANAMREAIIEGKTNIIESSHSFLSRASKVIAQYPLEKRLLDIIPLIEANGLELANAKEPDIELHLILSMLRQMKIGDFIMRNLPDKKEGLEPQINLDEYDEPKSNMCSLQ